MNTDRFKFRAWDKHRKCMVEDFVLAPTSPTWSAHLIRETSIELQNLINNYFQSKGDILGGDYTVLDWSDFYGINNYDLMQCTGLKDIEGNLIYEGDYVEVISNKNYPTPYVCQIIFKGMGFWFMDEDEELFVFHPETYHLTVIGNIYERIQE